MRIYGGCLILHLLLIFAVSSRDLFGLLEEGGNIFPKSIRPVWARGQQLAAGVLGEAAPVSNLFRQGTELYLQCAGIESGYSFFAPNVPSSYKLVFEVSGANGKVTTDLPEVGGSAAGLRLATLLENLGQTRSEPLRRRTIQKLTYSAWATHPDAVRIRAIFGVVLIPEPTKFLRTSQESYDVICAYDFFPPQPAPPN